MQSQPTHPTNFGDASLYSVAVPNASQIAPVASVSAAPKILDLNSASVVSSDIAAIPDASWGSLDEESKSGNSQTSQGADNLWSSFKSKEQELRMKERVKQQERAAREAKLAEGRRREAEQMRQQAEELKRQQQHELEMIKQQEEARKQEEERLLEEEREAARRARQEQKKVDLGEQSELMDFMNQFS
mmetsp:Transcript_16103/g.22649  ORF Transcript_16103/g.22649 Transcript_16103/m.22649 type:complete len:188 (-) Transcript_16103:181-744(-)